jgi:hypothetical protein
MTNTAQTDYLPRPIPAAATTQAFCDAWHIHAEDLPNIDDLVTEDDTPVDNLFSEKNQRLLTEPLYNAWQGTEDARGKRTFLVAANVGVFFPGYKTPLVPDAFVSMDVQAEGNKVWREHRAYFIWEFGKPPDVAIEIVSNRKGHEAGHKIDTYAAFGIRYYVIFDPNFYLSHEPLRTYRLVASPTSPTSPAYYQRMETAWFHELELGLILWNGLYEGIEATWLRWYDRFGMLVPTGAEYIKTAEAEREAARIAQQTVEAELERMRQQQEELIERLRQLENNE